jgi:hypothetical protein
MYRQAFLIKRGKWYLKPEKPAFFEGTTHLNNGTTIPVSQIKLRMDEEHLSRI